MQFAVTRIELSHLTYRFPIDRYAERLLPTAV
jgi:hypothetical protein